MFSDAEYDSNLYQRRYGAAVRVSTITLFPFVRAKSQLCKPWAGCRRKMNKVKSRKLQILSVRISIPV